MEKSDSPLIADEALWPILLWVLGGLLRNRYVSYANAALADRAKHWPSRAGPSGRRTVSGTDPAVAAVVPPLTAFVRRRMLTVGMTMTLGEKLRQLRETHDLSLRELAKQLGDVTAAHLSDIEFGRRFPSDDLLRKLAGFFRMEEKQLRALDTRPPVDELKRMAQTDPVLGLALRKLASKEITGEDILKLTKKKLGKPE